MKKLYSFIFIVMLLFLGCAFVPVQRDLQYEKYDQHTKFAVREVDDGFVFYIQHSVFQFFPSQNVVLESVKLNIIPILITYFEKNDISIYKPENDKVIAYVYRNGLTGYTTGTAEVYVKKNNK